MIKKSTNFKKKHLTFLGFILADLTIHLENVGKINAEYLTKRFLAAGGN